MLFISPLSRGVVGTILIFWWMVLVRWGNSGMGSASCGGNMLWVWCGASLITSKHDSLGQHWERECST